MAGLSLKRSRQAPAEETSAFGGVAERFRRAGDLDRAIALCREGLQRFPDLLSARVTLGWALLDKGEFAEARTELQQVLKRAPDNLAAIRGLAELHDRMDGADGGVESWHQPSESESVEAPKAPKSAKAPSRAAKASRGKSKRTADVPEPVAAPAPEPELEPEPEEEAELEPELERKLERELEAELAPAPVPEAAEVVAPAMFSAAAAAIEAAEAMRTDPAPARAQAEAMVAEVVASSRPDADPLSAAVDLTTLASEAIESAGASTAEGWEEPEPAVGQPAVVSQAVDLIHSQEAWEDADPPMAKTDLAEPQEVDLDAVALTDSDLASEAAALVAQAVAVSEDTYERPSTLVDADIALGDAGDADEAADLERLLATVELAELASGDAVAVENVDRSVPLVASADVVPFAELVTAADLAVAEAGKPVSVASGDSSVALPDASSAVVPLMAVEPVASSRETAEEVQALAALPPLDLITGEASPAPAPAVQSHPAKDQRSPEPVAQVVQEAVAPVLEQPAEPAAPEAISYQPSAAYEPATWHQPAAWHAPASPQPPTNWADDVAAHTPASRDEFASLSLGTAHSSRHTVTPRVSRKRAQVAALETLLRRVEARRLRLQAQSVA